MPSLAGALRRIRHVCKKCKRLFLINSHLENGTDVWLKNKRKRSIPPLRFRHGFTWHHGARDEPMLLFDEIFVDRFYEPLGAPANAIVLDVGANIGAVTLFWAAGRPDLRFHAYEPNPDLLRHTLQKR